MTKFIVGTPGDRIYQALHDAGVFKEDPSNVRRVIIDLETGKPARIYIDMFGDDSLTEVLLRGGIELVERSEDEASS